MQVGLLDADLHGPNVPKMLAIEDQPMPIRDGKLYPVVTPHNLRWPRSRSLSPLETPPSSGGGHSR